MKKWILSAVCAIAFGGFAAAQTTVKAATPVKEQKAVKKAMPVAKNVSAKQSKEKETGVKEGKLKVVLPPVDTSGVPKGKKEQ
jgi:hypothetical protein